MPKTNLVKLIKSRKTNAHQVARAIPVPQKIMTRHNHHHEGNSGRISIAFFLNLIFTVVEFIGGILTNSTAIMADAVHDLGDTLSIGFAWILSKLSDKHPDEEFTYGYYRFSGYPLNRLSAI